MADPVHIPVLRDRCVELLLGGLNSAGGVIVDATLGLGGHSEALLQAHPQVEIIGIDRDQNALRHATARLASFGRRFTPVHAVYDQVSDVLSDLGLPAVQGVLMDLGVSSMQLDDAERGFSYAQDAPLDMRMDANTDLTAERIVNTYSVKELARILRVYGEERFASRIAQRIVESRSVQPLTTSARLVEIVRDAIPAATRRTGGNPAKRTFQALRIEVNSELPVLTRALPGSLNSICRGGRIVVMSYHSLEDRIAKRALAHAVATQGPPDIPIVAEAHLPRFELITRGAETASAEEIDINPRARSVKLRAAQRIRPGELKVATQ